MVYATIKLIISAFLILAISEISKRVSWLGGLLASLPLLSYLALIWLYVDTQDKQKAASLSNDIFWLVIPSLPFFLTFPLFLKKFSFYPSLGFATLVMFASYILMSVILRQTNLLA